MRRLVAFAVDRAGVSPRQASHFFLLAQKKVTQKEGPNTSHLAGSLRLKVAFNGSATRTTSKSGPRWEFLCRSHCRSLVAEANRPNGLVFRPFALVTFIWARK